MVVLGGPVVSGRHPPRGPPLHCGGTAGAPQRGEETPLGAAQGLVLGRVPALSLWPCSSLAEVVTWLQALGAGPPGTWVCGPVT